ncbi:Coenzyme F420 hydrogenase/dehydrogenase, beta subunit C-terminal domain [Ventrimonas sp. CLA-AP-H27]|uniref:Coenzyme F420 hydrogenase/dehydrogenase, beta subunit C-terminal domain n=1 Tax=Ventrimonas faecis TaxID=3133170 RepID=A0ABV1HPD6_9FIRM
MLEFKNPKLWMQGWAKEESVRENSSSGGYATAIMRAFVEKDNCYVVSCVFEQGKFVFDAAKSKEECDRFTGSKYIKSNPNNAYRIIRNLLRENNKVLFLGLPCQVAGIKNYVGKNLEDNLYTIDLICHGTPSPNLLERYLRETYKKELQDISSIAFREKNDFDLREQRIRLTPISIQDRYTIAFLDSLDYTENCYSCDYARTDRISDLSLGDSWATQLPNEEAQKGISLALCQTKKGQYLLDIANIEKLPVDLEASVLANKQLQKPSIPPKQRADFFKRLKKSMKFSDAVLLAYPTKCVKQDIKYILYRLKLWGE